MHSLEILIPLFGVIIVAFGVVFACRYCAFYKDVLYVLEGAVGSVHAFHNLAFDEVSAQSKVLCSLMMLRMSLNVSVIAYSNLIAALTALRQASYSYCNLYFMIFFLIFVVPIISMYLFVLEFVVDYKGTNSRHIKV